MIAYQRKTIEPSFMRNSEDHYRIPFMELEFKHEMSERYDLAEISLEREGMPRNSSNIPEGGLGPS
jgi:hypothetical protein